MDTFDKVFLGIMLYLLLVVGVAIGSGVNEVLQKLDLIHEAALKAPSGYHIDTIANECIHNGTAWHIESMDEYTFYGHMSCRGDKCLAGMR